MSARLTGSQLGPSKVLSGCLKTVIIRETKGSKDVMARWVSRTDSLKAFVDSSQVQEVPGVDVAKKAFYEAFVKWCRM